MASQTPPTVSTERDSSILIATWNVNSLRMRWDRLSAWLADKRPDVLCLQEIKMQDADFPSLGYTAPDITPSATDRRPTTASRS